MLEIFHRLYKAFLAALIPLVFPALYFVRFFVYHGDSHHYVLERKTKSPADEPK